MGSAFLILGVCILGLVAASQAVQIIKLSKTLFSEYVTKAQTNKN